MTVLSGVTGTSMRYIPGVVVGGSDMVHDCGCSKSIGWFLEPLVLLGLFGKKVRGRMN